MNKPPGIGDFVASLKGDAPGHPFRGNQWGGGKGSASGIKISNATDAADALDTVGVPKNNILGIYSNANSARSAYSHAAPRSGGRAPIPRSIVRLQTQYAIIHAGDVDKALHIPDSEAILG